MPNMKKPLILGISGYAGVGKTELAKKLVRKFNSARKMAFGDQLRLEVANELAIPVKELQNKNKVIKGKTVREWLQNKGMERRHENPCYWVEALEKDLPVNMPVVIDDVRFFEEVSMIKNRGGRVIRLFPFPSWTPITNVNHISEAVMAQSTHLWDEKFFALDGEEEAVAEAVFNYWNWALSRLPIT